MLSTLNPFTPLKLTNYPHITPFSSQLFLSFKPFPRTIHYPYKYSKSRCCLSSNYPQRKPISSNTKHNSLKGVSQNSLKFRPLKKWDFVVVGLIKSGIVLGLVLVCSIIRCNHVLATEKGISVGGYVGFECINLLFRNAWPIIVKVLGAFKEHGVVLAILLGLSAFFSMAETSITTLWPWKETLEV